MDFDTAWKAIVKETRIALRKAGDPDYDEDGGDYSEQPFSICKEFTDDGKSLYILAEGFGYDIDFVICENNPPSATDRKGLFNVAYGDFIFDPNWARKQLLSVRAQSLKPPSKPSKPTLEETIAKQRLAGKSVKEIKEYLLEDLSRGIEAEVQRHFPEYKTPVTTKPDVTESGRDEHLYRWQANGPRVCCDCRRRDGEVNTYSYWEAAGLPKLAGTRCGEECHCKLIDLGSAVCNATD